MRKAEVGQWHDLLRDYVEERYLVELDEEAEVYAEVEQQDSEQ